MIAFKEIDAASIPVHSSRSGKYAAIYEAIKNLPCGRAIALEIPAAVPASFLCSAGSKFRNDPTISVMKRKQTIYVVRKEADAPTQ